MTMVSTEVMERTVQYQSGFNNTEIIKNFKITITIKLTYYHFILRT